MQRHLVVVLGLAACGGTAAPLAKPVPMTVPAPYEPEFDCEEVEDAAEKILGIDTKPDKGVPFEAGVTVDVRVCRTGPDPSPDSADAGGDNRKALLVLYGRKPEPFELGTWSDGWEWGGSWHLEGVLRSPKGNAVVVSETGYSEDSHGHTLHVFAIVGDTWDDVFTEQFDEAEIEVESSGATASVSSCTDKGERAWEHACRDDPKRVTTKTLRWDGTKLHAE